MTPRMMGMETEYALAANGSIEAMAERLTTLATQRLVHLRGARSSGLFLESGARFYVDLTHPEWCTPEVDHPTDAVRYAAAGDAIVGQLVAELRQRHPRSDGILLLKCNVDYLQPGMTWAAHESYLHSGPGDQMPRQLIPHLVSRVYLGSGGLNPLCPGIQFSMAPRLHIFSEVASNSTTSDRGIFNKRDESLTGNEYRRLHVICGDSLCSQKALWLKLATTALVVAMAEAGLDPGGAVQVRLPVFAMHSFATDPSFRATAELVGGDKKTALQIQRHYLRVAQAHLEHACMPPWAAEACDRWQIALDVAERGPAAAAQLFDWAAKHALFAQHISRRGMDAQKFTVWNHAMTAVRDAHRRAENTWRFDRAILQGPHPAVVQERAHLTAFLRSHGLCWEQAAEFLAVRDQLCEIDMRYSQATPAGLHATLEPHLHHRLLEPAVVNEAKRTPPSTTRARLRGNHVRRNAGKQTFRAEWDAVYNDEGMYLDLSDPFAKDATWKTVAPDDEVFDGIRPVIECLRLYERGRLAAAHSAASHLAATIGDLSVLEMHERHQLRRTLAWTHARRGERDSALGLLDAVARELAEIPAWLVSDYLYVYRESSLIPDGQPYWDWVARGRTLATDNRQAGSRPALLGHLGFAMKCRGQFPEALASLQQACRECPTGQRRIRARSLADMADVHRLLGNAEPAQRCIQEAESLQILSGYASDLADLTLIVRAKMESNRRAAGRFLRKAERIQIREESQVALVRNLLIQSRLCIWRRRSNRLRQRIEALRPQVPSLAACPLLERILAQWDDLPSHGSEAGHPIAIEL